MGQSSGSSVKRGSVGQLAGKAARTRCGLRALAHAVAGDGSDCGLARGCLEQQATGVAGRKMWCGTPAQQWRYGLWRRHSKGAALWGYSSSAGPWRFAHAREGPGDGRA